MSWEEPFTELESSLYLSWILARAHSLATPGLTLAWNPRDLDGMIEAAQKLLHYIDENLFPVHEIYDEEADAVWDTIANIPVRAMGYEIFDDDESFVECSTGSVWRLCLIYVHLYELDYDVYWTYAGYAELRNFWQVETLAPLWAIADWMEANPDDPEVRGLPHALGMIYFIRYLSNSTGHPFLDMSPAMMGQSGQTFPWSEKTVANLTEQWQEARPVNTLIKAFMDWSKEGEGDERPLQVARVMNHAARAVIAAQEDKMRWSLMKLQIAYDRLGGKDADEVEEREISEAMENWEDVDMWWGDDEEE